MNVSLLAEFTQHLFANIKKQINKCWVNSHIQVANQRRTTYGTIAP